MDTSDEFPAFLALPSTRKFAKPRTMMKRKSDPSKVDGMVSFKKISSNGTPNFINSTLDTEISKHSSSSIEEEDFAAVSVNTVRHKRSPLQELDYKKHNIPTVCKGVSPGNTSFDIAESELDNFNSLKRIRSSSSLEAEDTCTLDCNLRVDSGNQAQTSNQEHHANLSLHWGVRGRRKSCSRVTSPPTSEVDLKSKLCAESQHCHPSSRPCTPLNGDVDYMQRKTDHSTHLHLESSSERLQNVSFIPSHKLNFEAERNLRGSSFSSESPNVKALIISLTRNEIVEDFKSLGVRLLQKPRNRRPKKIEKMLQPLMLCTRLLNPSLTAETLLQEYNPKDEKKTLKHKASGLKAIARNEALKRFNKKFPSL